MAAPKGFLIVPVGFRSDGTLRALELTDSDELKIALTSAAGSDLLTELQAKLETADLELVSKIVSAGPHGWIGGAWRRNPLLLGYSGVVSEAFTTTASNGGDTDTHSTFVPAGEIHHVNFISFFHNDPSARNLIAYALHAGNTRALAYHANVAIWVIMVFSTPFVLGPGDNIRVRCQSLANTKTVYGYYWATRVDIDQ